MKNVIITASDENYGEFLINHYLKSLKENVDMKNVDILVLDYGLTKEQVIKLKNNKIIVKKCNKDGNIGNIRFRDAAQFLSKRFYDQVLMTDGGDIIFQKDISEIFKKNKDEFRAVVETYFIINLNTTFSNVFFGKENVKKMYQILKGKKMINCGVVLGPKNKMLSLSKEVYSLIKNKYGYGPDQAAVNYVLYRDGFKALDQGYNMIFQTCKREFFIENGEFYFENGKKIPIVHNAGGKDFMRIIKNFGYGKKYNKIRKLNYYVLRSIGKIRNKIMR